MGRGNGGPGGPANGVASHAQSKTWRSAPRPFSRACSSKDGGSGADIATGSARRRSVGRLEIRNCHDRLLACLLACLLASNTGSCLCLVTPRGHASRWGATLVGLHLFFIKGVSVAGGTAPAKTAGLHPGLHGREPQTLEPVDGKSSTPALPDPTLVTAIAVRIRPRSPMRRRGRPFCCGGQFRKTEIG